MPISRFPLILLLFLFSGSSFGAVRWTMVNVNRAHQGDAHLLEFSGGAFLIDSGGAGQGLLDYLRGRGIGRIEGILISHAHKDHYGGIKDLINGGIKIGSIWMNFPPAEICDKEKPWGCDSEELAQLKAELKRLNLPVRRLTKGSVIHREKGGEKLSVLYSFDGLDTPVGKTCVNDTSAILKLQVGKFSALFTGDLNRPLGEYLAKHGKNLASDILKVPHHGTESVAPNDFFDRVNPKLALVPAPKDLWLSDRSRRVREYFEGKKIPTYVNGVDGHVTVEIGANGYKILLDGKRG